MHINYLHFCLLDLSNRVGWKFILMCGIIDESSSEFLHSYNVQL